MAAGMSADDVTSRASTSTDLNLEADDRCGRQPERRRAADARREDRRRDTDAIRMDGGLQHADRLAERIDDGEVHRVGTGAIQDA